MSFLELLKIEFMKVKRSKIVPLIFIAPLLVVKLLIVWLWDILKMMSLVVSIIFFARSTLLIKLVLRKNLWTVRLTL